MTSSCTLYGLGLSVNVPLAALNRLPPASRIDVQIYLGPLPSWHQDLRSASTEFVYTGEPQEAMLQVRTLSGGDFFEFAYRDGTRVIIDRPGSHIWAEGPATATPEDTATYLLGPVLGFVLRRRGTLCLHASAVNIEGRAIAFLGAPGAGKSTTAACFAEKGYPVLTDDVAAINERDGALMLQPGYPRLNLWPESAELLFGSADVLPHITPTWEKRYLDLMDDGYHFQQEPLQLAAIYILGDRSHDQTAPFVGAIRPAACLMALVANSSANYLLDTALRVREFENLPKTIDAVHMRRVTPHADPVHIARLSDVILTDFHSLPRHSAA